MKEWIIYTLSSPDTPDEIRYVGATSLSIEKRKKSHIRAAKYSNKNYHNLSWIRKLLKMNLEPNIEALEYCNENNWQELEIYWIERMKSLGFKLTNTAIGGKGVKNMPKEIRKKISLSNRGSVPWNKGVPCSDETKEKIRLSTKGKSVSKETREKLRQRMMGEKNHLFGKSRKLETIEKIKNTFKNKSELEKQYYKNLISKSNSKSIVQYTKNMIFVKKWKSATQANNELGIRASHISECCNNKRKTAGGYCWKFEK